MVAKVAAKANIKLNTVSNGFVSTMLAKKWAQSDKLTIKVSIGTRKATSISEAADALFVLLNF